jgi:O-antigen ligase
LPGRARYLNAAIAAGEAQPWRPINLAPDRGWNALFALLPPAAVLVAVGRLRLRDQASVLTAFLIVIVASAVIGLAQVSAGGGDTLRLYAAPPTGSAVGLLANRDHQALLIACGLPMLGVWGSRTHADRAGARLRGALALAIAAFLVLMIPTTGSRAGLVLTGLALPLTVILAWGGIAKFAGKLSLPQRRLVFGGALAAFAALIAAALTFSRAEAVRRLFETDPIDDARVRLLRPLVAMIRDFWPVGSGFGSFDPVYRGYEPFGDLAVTIMNQAHDDYLQIVMEAGLPGLLLLLVFLGWWGWTSVQLWRRTDDGDKALGRLGSVLILLMMLASIVDYPVRMPLIMVLAAQSAAWMLLQQRPPVGTATREAGK